MEGGALFTPGRIGPVDIPNRIVRAGTSETAAGEAGGITDTLVDIYETLARNQVGLILTGHMFCHPRGRYADRQAGIHDDDVVGNQAAGLSRFGGVAGSSS